MRKVQGVVTGLLSWAEVRRLEMGFVGLRDVDVNYWDQDASWWEYWIMAVNQQKDLIGT